MHYSPRTEEAYVRWIRAFIRFHRPRHPRELGAPEVTAFLNSLARYLERLGEPEGFLLLFDRPAEEAGQRVTIFGM